MVTGCFRFGGWIDEKESHQTVEQRRVSCMYIAKKKFSFFLLLSESSKNNYICLPISDENGEIFNFFAAFQCYQT